LLRKPKIRRIAAKFYASGTVESHLDLLGEWLRRYGRPGALYTDRHSIFELQDKGRALPEGMTQFGRALSELDVELIRAHSPQAKGRVERLFGTAQDRWVKEMRLANVRTIAEANAMLERLVMEYNRRFTQAAQSPNDAHRGLGPSHRLDSILSIQSERVVSNDYTIRFENRSYQLLKPAYPGERGGRVVIEQKLDGTMSIRFRGHYLSFHEVKESPKLDGIATPPSASNARSAGAADERPGKSATKSGSAETGKKSNAKSGPKRPAKNHPWRKSYK
jgi:hypothetical protein